MLVGQSSFAPVEFSVGTECECERIIDTVRRPPSEFITVRVLRHVM
jgi:hypothetical protein